MKDFDKTFNCIVEVSVGINGFCITYSVDSENMYFIEQSMNYKNPTGHEECYANILYNSNSKSAEILLAEWVISLFKKIQVPLVAKSEFYTFTSIMNQCKTVSGGCFIFEGKTSLKNLWEIVSGQPAVEKRTVMKSSTNCLGNHPEFNKLLFMIK